MCSRYAERQGWRIELLSASLPNTASMAVSRKWSRASRAREFFRNSKFETGYASRAARAADRGAGPHPHVQRRLSRSCRRIDEVEDVALNPADLKVDTFRSSGAGGQHVKQDRFGDTHHASARPASSSNAARTRRSQHKNQARAMSRCSRRACSTTSARSRSAARRNHAACRWARETVFSASGHLPTFRRTASPTIAST